ncbi:MAG: prepilin-type N-terminal cleavage/methylation domain-containing protein [Planctomycetota bacterium]
MRPRVPAFRTPRCGRPGHCRCPGFTLIELLVTIGIIALLISILVPSLSAARQRGKAVRCLSNLRVLGQGIYIYLGENRDVLPAGRLPRIDNCNTWSTIYGRVKYRPTFLALMSGAVGVPPFIDPQACANRTDMFGEPGDRQNYSCEVYLCPSTLTWTDERNGSYGFNYQFLGNSRLLVETNPDSPYRNWPVKLNWVRFPGRTVAVADCMGTAASYAPPDRGEYVNNARESWRLGNEGFNLDPPRCDPVRGEMAGFPTHRSAVDPRHADKGNVLYVDGHARAQSLAELGYRLDGNGVFRLDGDNTQWTASGVDVPWTPEYSPLMY